MEPDRQIEIQLGHMCNNRCVFCVSGQRTADGEAGPVPIEPVVARLRQARALGHRKVTLLGGEPTLQPGFLAIVRETVDLGYEEIVIFTNGVKTARAEVVDAVLATGGNFTWRISIQGATRESHERTTRKPGSFGRILRTLANLRARGQRITVNMCVVTSNYEDIGHFPALLLEHGAEQLHLDLMRPLDAGRRSDEELRASMPPLRALVAPMRGMVAAFPPGFDVNLGNLPYCVAPDLAPVIHHDGQPTETIAIDGRDRLSAGWDKYLVKRRDKIHPPSCERCVMRARCSGVFETYARFYGLDELQPISAEALRDADPEGRLVGVWASALLAAALPAWRIRSRSDHEVALHHGELRLRLTREPSGALARYARFAIHHEAGAASAEALASLAGALLELDAPVHPLGPELATPLAAPLAGALARLRAASPFGGLRWTGIEIAGDRAALALEAGDGGRAELWLELSGGRPSGGYRLHGEPTPTLVEGLRAALRALRGRAARP